MFVTSILAQEKFVVPEFTDAQKHARMVSQWRGMIFNSIRYAKTFNQSFEDAAKITSDYFKTSGNEEAGYEGFAKGTLNDLAVLVPNNNLVILEQSNTSLKIRSKNLFGNLKNDGTMYGITYTEFMTFMKTFHEIIAEYLGSEITFQEVKDGIILTVKKKSS